MRRRQGCPAGEGSAIVRPTRPACRAARRAVRQASPVDHHMPALRRGHYCRPVPRKRCACPSPQLARSRPSPFGGSARPHSALHRAHGVHSGAETASKRTARPSQPRKPASGFVHRLPLTVLFRTVRHALGSRRQVLWQRPQNVDGHRDRNSCAGDDVLWSRGSGGPRARGDTVGAPEHLAACRPDADDLFHGTRNVLHRVHDLRVRRRHVGAAKPR